MHVEDVEVAGLEFLERRFEGELKGFRAVTAVVGLDFIAAFVLLIGAGVFCCLGGSVEGISHHEETYENDLVPVASSSHPFSDPGLGLFVLIRIGSINEVASFGVEVVKNGERLRFGTSSHS